MTDIDFEYVKRTVIPVIPLIKVFKRGIMGIIYFMRREMLVSSHNDEDIWI